MKKLFSVLFAMTILIVISFSVTDVTFSQKHDAKRCLKVSTFGITSDGSYCRPLAGVLPEVIANWETMSFRIYF